MSNKRDENGNTEYKIKSDLFTADPQNLLVGDPSASPLRGHLRFTSR